MSAAATRSCSAFMAVNEMSSAASVVIWIWPMSSSGKKPLGMLTKSQAVTTKVSPAMTSISGRCPSVQSSVRM
ncbi:hypothetical protein D3C72_1663320 [compost metagenome]